TRGLLRRDAVSAVAEHARAQPYVERLAELHAAADAHHEPRRLGHLQIRQTRRAPNAVHPEEARAHVHPGAATPIRRIAAEEETAMAPTFHAHVAARAFVQRGRGENVHDA